MGKKFEKGVNDLATWCKSNNRQDLLEEWDSSNDVFPDQISYGSHKKVKWICKNGHHYEKDIHSRCQGTGCPKCSGVNFEHKRNLFEEYPTLLQEVDIDKNPLNTVQDISSGSAKKIYWKCEQGHSYEMSAVNKIKSRGCPFCHNKRVMAGENDLVTWCKDNGRTQILDDWNYEKNMVLPNEITYGSNVKAWFKCHICGYEWQTVVNSRTIQHSDCRMCSRRINSSFPEQCVFYYVSIFFPDAVNGDRSILDGRELDIWVPSLRFAVEYDGKKWHKNDSKDIEKDKLCKDRGIILYRIREKGCKELNSADSILFEYEYGDWNALSKIIIEILEDVGMKNCDVNISRDEYIVKEKYYTQSLANSLGSLYPQLAKEWHPTKNGKITPDLIIAETHDLYHWLCPEGHTYKASPKNRIRMNSNCPYCSGQKVLQGYNDLETTHPEIALDYDNNKNTRKSYEVSRGCSDFVWLKCHKCGYEFYYQLNTYVSNGGLCPVCSQSGKTKFQKVLKYETMEIFDTLPQAALSIELDADEKRLKSIYKNICNSCNGKTVMAHGFHWFYVNVDKDGKIMDDIDSFEIKNVDKHIVGQSKIMNNGQKATVVRDGGSADIDIEFEDGTIVHTRRQSFRLGVVRNPNYFPMLNQTKTDKAGKKMTIVGYRNSNDIDVEYEDGEIVKNTSLTKFNKGTVKNTKKKSIVGKTNIMKSGENATCIRDNGWNDIDICFEDETVVKHVSRCSFLDGTVKNPNYIFTFIGMEKKMNCGLKCKIIDVIKKDDISVQFEDGDIVEHTSLLKFKKGTILTNALSHNYKYITGQRKLMKCGLYATVIADRGAHDIDVQFDDGTIVKNKERANFNKGEIGIPRNGSILGMTKIMNNGMSATVIVDNGWDNIDVQFENGIIVKHRRREHFKRGSISIE